MRLIYPIYYIYRSTTSLRDKAEINSHRKLMADMASISPIPKMKLKLLVDKNSEKVVFAEADKDFIDFLIHLLSLPVATAVRLLKEKTIDVGSLSHFYESLQNLPDSYLKPNQNKYSLLNPRVPILSAAAAATEISRTLTSDGREFEFDTIKAYTCASCISHMAVVPNLICPKCECRSMNRELSYVNPPLKGGGFLKGLVSYFVMDNLEFIPMSTKMFVSLLNKFDVEDLSALEETEVEVGVEEEQRRRRPLSVQQRRSLIHMQWHPTAAFPTAASLLHVAVLANAANLDKVQAQPELLMTKPIREGLHPGN
ncbi:hypothetical protein EZV62_025575 [Acer yangbiense]|uniref:DUF674 domain-containing protein n=1 Tax=Acer yangbiense TaxID=1000413 RepID=A0A5C7GY93_9ROSI|nr:hypothetical protein EZV62_025575 [Acer yangbiense]